MTTTRSRLLDNELIGREEVIARSARNAIGSLRLTEENPTNLADPIALEHTRKVQAFFSQPFFVARALYEMSGLSCQPGRPPAWLPRNTRRQARRPPSRCVLFHGQHRGNSPRRRVVVKPSISVLARKARAGVGTPRPFRGTAVFASRVECIAD